MTPQIQPRHKELAEKLVKRHYVVHVHPFLTDEINYVSQLLAESEAAHIKEACELIRCFIEDFVDPFYYNRSDLKSDVNAFLKTHS